MNKILFCFMCLMIFSCGNKNDTKSSVLAPPNNDETIVTEATPPINSSSENTNQYCEDETCYEEIVSTNSVGLEEIVLSPQVRIEDERIIVDENVEEVSSDQNLTCEFKFEVGDEYQYKILKNKLLLEMNNRKFVFVSLGEEENNLYGSWIWRGREGNTSVMMTLNILPNDKMILRKNCELK